MIDDVSRRHVIGLGLGAAALSTLGRAQPADTGVGFAVVGLGKLSLGQIVPGFRNCRSARLTALVSGHADKANRIAAEQHLPAGSVYSYADFDRIAADPRIDVVYIVLPNFMHAEYTIRALKAGKHVLCEKPMATTVADAEAMVAAAKAANRKLMIAYRCHTEPLNVEAMRRVRSGELGKSRLVITKMVRQSNLNDPSDAWRLDMTKSGGGALADMGIYGINGARYLLNEEPVEVRATARTDRGDPRFKTVEDFYSWEFKFPPERSLRARPPSMRRTRWLTRSTASTSASSPIPAASTAAIISASFKAALGRKSRSTRSTSSRARWTGWPMWCEAKRRCSLQAKRACRTCG